MNRIFIKFTLSIVLCLPSQTSFAQSACDKLFSAGVKLQQTMTFSSQKNAISYFEKAKICYDSQSKKDLCDEQIKACRNIINQLTKSKQKETPQIEEQPEVVLIPDSVAVEPEEKRDIELSLDCIYLKFKGKGGEFKKAKVTCNYDDWEIIEIPSWVSCSRNEDNEIIIEVEKNPEKEERAGIIKIECGDKYVTLTIIQEKPKKFGI